MSPTRIVTFVVVAALLALAVHRSRDPRRTALPFGTTDLSSVQRQLDRLSKADRALVVGYVERSGGDVLPAKFADPDEPLTARTFAEAIALQRRFLAGQAVVAVEVATRRRARDSALAPLRAAVEVEVVGREIVPREQLLRAPGSYDAAAYGGQAKTAIDDTPVVVTTYRLRNVSSLTVDSLKGNVDVRTVARGPAGYGSRLGDCFIDHRQPLAPGQSAEVSCADANEHASASDSAYVAMPNRDLVVDWMPRSIAFADGTSLAYTGD